MKKMDVHYSSKKHDYGTPPELFKKLDDLFHFDLDVCASKENTKCPKYYEWEDGLDEPWENMNWMNPPYGRFITKWMDKAGSEWSRYRRQTVALVPARTDTKWFHHYAFRAPYIVFIEGRITFEESPGVPCPSPASFPNALVLYVNSLSANQISGLTEFGEVRKKMSLPLTNSDRAAFQRTPVGGFQGMWQPPQLKSSKRL